MKLIENTPQTQEKLESWWTDLEGMNVPVTAVQNYSYVISDHDLFLWVDKHYRGQEEEFYEALGVNTRPREGVYLCDINNAIRRMKGKATSWD